MGASHVSGGAAPVDRCTERRCDTNDCRQLHPVGEVPSRRAHRGIGQNHMPDWWVEAGIRSRGRGVLGCEDGSLACPSVEGSSMTMGPFAGGGASRVSSCMSPCRFSSVPPRRPVEPAVYPPECPRVPVSGRLPSVPPGGPEGRDHPGEVPPALGRPPWLEQPPAGGRASGRPRRGGASRRGGAWLRTGWWGLPRVGPLEGSVARPACLRLTGPAPQGQAICMAVGRNELRARVPTTGYLLRVRHPHGKGRGQGLLGLRPLARVQQESPGPPLGGWHEIQALSEVNGPILREAPPIGAPGTQRSPLGVPGAWPLRGNG